MKVFGISLLCATFIASQTNLAGAEVSYNSCDADATRGDVPLIELTRDEFVKICPHTDTEQEFGTPQCGDGSPFSFFVNHQQAAAASNNTKILIEVQGGGACWDGQTCTPQQDLLTFPAAFDAIRGNSCSEVATVFQLLGLDIEILCAGSVGDVDFREYTTIFIPYCTQDVHMGNNVIEYEDGSTVHHMGAHNLQGVLRWIFQNIPNPSHIVVTGCSAGGTALPLVYTLLSQFYNPKSEVRKTPISVLGDSPVFLTPDFFLTNKFQNWNPGSILEAIGFDFASNRLEPQFFANVVDHMISEGSTEDPIGIVSHNQDGVSLFYYQLMSNDPGGTMMAWWEDLSYSFDRAQELQGSVQTYIINGTGHCLFGLDQALQDPGFEDWASSILRARSVINASADDTNLELTPAPSPEESSSSADTSLELTPAPSPDESSSSAEGRLLSMPTTMLVRLLPFSLWFFVLL
jgi:hypothetical protein